MMKFLSVFTLLSTYFLVEVNLQGFGSGNNGNLRLCVVEGRGFYKKAQKHCPTLDNNKSGIECVIGTDRLDCLRRISKGTVDFGAFTPEDLVAAQWANVDVLVTNELRMKSQPFAYNIVALVNRRILPVREGKSLTSNILRNRTLCAPVTDNDNIRTLNDVLWRYLDSQVEERSCDPNLSLAENRIRSTANFFGSTCMAGPWVQDPKRDAELKHKYPSLCSACTTHTCGSKDIYWGPSGALNCMIDSTGDVTWVDVEDFITYVRSLKLPDATLSEFAYLCRDGSWQPVLNNTEPCVWLQKPWNVIVSKRKTTTAVIKVTSALTSNSATVNQNWTSALAALIESNQELPEPLQPPRPPADYLSAARGFREAYSRHECDPPRHITLCTTSLLESNKCEWLSEAGAVYGIVPPLQCNRRNSTTDCMRAIERGECDVTVASSDWLVPALRDHSIVPILHEATPIIDKTTTVVAFARRDSQLTKMADLRGKRVAFPRFDGVAFHSVLSYFSNKENTPIKTVVDEYFSEICAPGIEKYNVSEPKREAYTRNCYKDGDIVMEGEEQALRAVVEEKADVAFVSLRTYNMYKAKKIVDQWTRKQVQLVKICPEENKKYCFISWANVGHVFASKNLTMMRYQEIVNVFTKFDKLFGRSHTQSAMFSIYGQFNHNLDVIFHNETKTLLTDEMYKMIPYDKIPFSFEKSYNLTDEFSVSDLTRSFAIKNTCSLLLMSVLSLLIFVR